MWFDKPGLIIGGLIAGVAFGFLLQKGQVAKYRVIIGQFLFTDYTVLKIMLTAIVVGAVGVWGMLQLGMIQHLQVKPAVLAANAVGGLIFGLGQLSTGLAAAGQVALAAFLGLGQLATGYIAIGQLALGRYVLAQAGFGEFVWSVKRADPQAIEFFKSLPLIRYFIH
jgi:hypothetical protein